MAANKEPYSTNDAKELAKQIRNKINEDLVLKASLEIEWNKDTHEAGTFENYLYHITAADIPKYWGEGQINSPVVALLKDKAIAIYNQIGLSYKKNLGQIYCPPDFENQAFLHLAFNGTNHYNAFVT